MSRLLSGVQKLHKNTLGLPENGGFAAVSDGSHSIEHIETIEHIERSADNSQALPDPEHAGRDSDGVLSSAQRASSNLNWLVVNAPRILGDLPQEPASPPASLEADDPSATWPWWLISVGIFALLLLAAGGHALVREYAAMRDEIVMLQAELATAVTAEMMAEQKQVASELQTIVDDLIHENSELKERVQGLQTKLKVSAPHKDHRVSKQQTLSDSHRPNPISLLDTKSGLKSLDGSWFVNFGSYYNSNTAREWSQRLNPAAGEVAISTAGSGEGMLYRVRIVGLPTRQYAEQLAEELEEEYDLDRLWVGKRQAEPGP